MKTEETYLKQLAELKLLKYEKLFDVDLIFYKCIVI